MPRKRRKAVASTITPDIPYPKVRVEWIDCVSDSGWATEKEFDRMKLARPINEGWLYEKTKEHIKLFASYDKDSDEISFGDRTMIPNGAGRMKDQKGQVMNLRPRMKIPTKISGTRIIGVKANGPCL